MNSLIVCICRSYGIYILDDVALNLLYKSNNLLDIVVVALFLTITQFDNI